MNATPDPKNTPVQFGIGKLMVITLLVAVIMAISVRMNAPRMAQGLFAGYLFFFVGWGIVRGPKIFADLREVNNKRLILKQRRGDLEREYKIRLENRAKGLEESLPRPEKQLED